MVGKKICVSCTRTCACVCVCMRVHHWPGNTPLARTLVSDPSPISALFQIHTACVRRGPVTAHRTSLRTRLRERAHTLCAYAHARRHARRHAHTYTQAAATRIACACCLVVSVNSFALSANSLEPNGTRRPVLRGLR